jgi:hypothetical protein
MGQVTVDSGDLCKVVLEWTLPDNVIANTSFHWYRSDVAGDPMSFVTFMSDVNAEIDSYLDGVDAAMADVVATTKITGYTLVYVGGKWETEGLMGQSALVHAMTANYDMLPHGVCGLITYPTLYPRVRGRHYLPGFTENGQVDGAWSAGIISALETWGTAFISGFTGSGGETFAAAVPGSIGSAIVLTSRVVSAYPAYQRRRRP